MKLAARAVVGLAAAGIAATTFGMGAAQAAPAQYRIEVRTCNVENAGTDSGVQARLNGGAWIRLDNSGDDRERGNTDVYDKTLTDVGPINAVDLTFDNKGDSSHWCLEEVVVRGPHGVTIHPFHNWLARPYTAANPLRLPAA